MRVGAPVCIGAKGSSLQPCNWSAPALGRFSRTCAHAPRTHGKRRLKAGPWAAGVRAGLGGGFFWNGSVERTAGSQNCSQSQTAAKLLQHRTGPNQIPCACQLRRKAQTGRTGITGRRYSLLTPGRWLALMAWRTASMAGSRVKLRRQASVTRRVGAAPVLASTTGM